MAAMSLPQVQDLFIEPRGFDGPIVLTLMVLLFWSMPAYRAALRMVSKVKDIPPAESLFCTIVDEWLPRLLGLAPFVIVGVALPGLATSIDGLGALPEQASSLRTVYSTAAWLVAATILYLMYLLLRATTLQHGPATAPWLALSKFFSHGHAILVFSAFLWAFISPFSFGTVIGRAALLPVLLGGWLLLLTPLAIASHRARAPLVLFCFVMLFLVSSLNGRFHDVRTFKSQHWQAAQLSLNSAPSAKRQIDVNEAIRRWMAANDCLGRVEACPNVVLIAATGGGSRAAFFTATTIGTILDETRSHPETYHDFGRAVFAISGVSGGSVGATMVRAALSDARPDGTPPCIHKTALWFGSTYSRDVTKSWRACLQELAAGDFLTPVISGLVLRDLLAIPAPTDNGAVISDRNILLEKAVERHYNSLVGGVSTACGGPEDVRGLCQPLGYLASQTVGLWNPMLILGMTSVDNGNRIVASELNIAYKSGDVGESDFVPFTHGVFELMAAAPAGNLADEMPAVMPGIERAPDLRLSTASILSARFPIVQTPGTLRTIDGEIADRIVDGGYFDNSGLGVLRPLIPALANRGLRPIVVLISNAPWDDYEKSEPIRIHEKKYLRLAGRHHASDNFNEIRRPIDSYALRPLQGILSPLATLNSIRAARAREDEADFVDRLRVMFPSLPYYEIRVTRQPTFLAENVNRPWCLEQDVASTLSIGDVVMSWWLSPVVQHFIDLQMCESFNDNSLRQIFEGLKRRLPT